MWVWYTASMGFYGSTLYPQFVVIYGEDYGKSLGPSDCEWMVPGTVDPDDD